MFLNKKKYFYGVGKKKTSISKVYMKYCFKNFKINLYNNIIINGKNFFCYFNFNRKNSYHLILEPLIITENLNNFFIKIRISGGGTSGQIFAIRYGICRALIMFDSSLKDYFYKQNILIKDSRKVERKKLGFHKARKKHQFSKR